jgi:hypothetical protein
VSICTFGAGATILAHTSDAELSKEEEMTVRHVLHGYRRQGGGHKIMCSHSLRIAALSNYRAGR